MIDADVVAGRSVSAIVLAAGRGSRMGETKQLLPLAGRAMLEHVLCAARDAERVSEVVVVLGCEAEKITAALASAGHDDVRITVNADWPSGISSSLKSGLGAADVRVPAACVLLGDQPSIGSKFIDRMIDEFFARPEPLLRPVYRDGRGRPVPGHPVVVSRSLWAEIDALAGDEGLRTLIARQPHRLGTIDVAGEAPADVDDEEDYVRERRAYDDATRTG